LASARLLTSDAPENQTPSTNEGEVPVSEHNETPPEEGSGSEVKAETPSTPETLAEDHSKKKAEGHAKPAEHKDPEAHPSKNKVTFFIVVGIIVLGLGAIGAAHFLKNSQFTR
jgi:hypothetical protein